MEGSFSPCQRGTSSRFLYMKSSLLVEYLSEEGQDGGQGGSAEAVVVLVPKVRSDKLRHGHRL